MNTSEEKFIYCREALKMPHTMNKKELLLEQLWKKYESLKFSNTFPMEKSSNYNLLKLPCYHKARQVVCPSTSSIITIVLCMKITVNIKHGFPSLCCWFFEFLVELLYTTKFYVGKLLWLECKMGIRRKTSVVACLCVYYCWSTRPSDTDLLAILTWKPNCSISCNQCFLSRCCL